MFMCLSSMIIELYARAMLEASVVNAVVRNPSDVKLVNISKGAGT